MSAIRPSRSGFAPTKGGPSFTATVSRTSPKGCRVFFEPDELRVIAVREQAHFMSYLPGGHRVATGLGILALQLGFQAIAIGVTFSTPADWVGVVMLIAFSLVTASSESVRFLTAGFLYLAVPIWADFRDEPHMDRTALRATGDHEVVLRTVKKLLQLSGESSDRHARVLGIEYIAKKGLSKE